MNQILFIPNRQNYEKNKTKKKRQYPIYIFSFFSFITFMVLSFQIYAYNNENQSNDNILIESVASKTSNLEDEIMPVIKEENTENEEMAQNNDTEEEKAQYKASNGTNYEVIGILNIPSLGIEYPILSSTSTELLKISLTKYHGANPNEVGNMVVLGHNYQNGQFFSNLHKIKKKDIIKITDLQGTTLNYEVYDFKVIDPYDNSGTSQLTNGKTEITLITCYNNGTERFMVKARAK